MQAWSPFPGSLCLIARLDDVPAEAVSYAEERFLQGVAHPARRRQSQAARSLAREALRRLGGPACGIGRGAGGVPLWPAGWVGSLAHDAAHAVALLAPRTVAAALGVDVEPLQPLPEDAAALVLDAQERAALERLPGGYARWSRAAFGAKECVHKCVNPLTGAWLEFAEVKLRFDAAHQTFAPEPGSASAAAAARGLGGTLGSGCVWFGGGAVVTALALPASAGREAGAGAGGRGRAALQLRQQLLLQPQAQRAAVRGSALDAAAGAPVVVGAGISRLQYACPV